MWLSPRKRVVYSFWHRDPDGPILPSPPPLGKRTPNGLIWGEDWDSFYFCEVIPRRQLVRIWSRTMIIEHGEDYFDEIGFEGEINPCVVPPYRLLNVDKMGEVIEDRDVEEDEEGEEANTDKGKEEEVPDEQEDKGHKEEAQDEREDNGKDEEAQDKPEVEGKEEEAQNKQEDNSKGKTTARKIQDQEIPVKDLPKLEEFIPEKYFPDILEVYDPDDLATGTRQTRREHPQPRKETPILYKRVWPTPESRIFKPSLPMISERFLNDKMDAAYKLRDYLKAAKASWAEPSSASSTPAEPRVARLYFDDDSRMGRGNHSIIYRCALTLPAPLTAASPTGQVAVAAKLAHNFEDARTMLKHEAHVFNNFPRHLMEEWNGLTLVPCHKYPVPPEPVVPKFYGYYEPVNPFHERYEFGLSPILLMEEVGTELDPKKLDIDEQSQCYTHLLRLHNADIIHGSTYVRNIMVQPGPLYEHPSLRSKKTPSFRIIDFGRAELFADWFKKLHKKDVSELERLPPDEQESLCGPWGRHISMNEHVAREALGIDISDA